MEIGLFYYFPKAYNYITRHYIIKPDEIVFYEQQLFKLLQLEQLKENAVVVDLACGTGEYALQFAEQRADIRVIGVDPATKMLEKGTQMAREKGLTNVYFMAKDALSLTAQDITNVVGNVHDPKSPIDAIVCSFGLTAMRNYEAVFKNTLSLLHQGGAYVIADTCYAERSYRAILMQSLVIGMLFGANQFRKPYQLLERDMDNFVIHEKAMKTLGIPIRTYVAKGIKK